MIHCPNGPRYHNSSTHCHGCQPDDLARSSSRCPCGNFLPNERTINQRLVNKCHESREQEWLQVKDLVRTDNAHQGTFDVLKGLPRVAPEFFFPATTHLQQHDLMTQDTTIYTAIPLGLPNGFSARTTITNVILQVISEDQMCKHALYVWVEPNAKLGLLANAVCGVKPSLTENVRFGGNIFKARDNSGGSRTLLNTQTISSIPLRHCDTVAVREWL